MLLKRVNLENGKVVGYYESSNIVKSIYDDTKKELDIVFTSGKKYTYEDVNETEYMLFERAESQGKILNTNIKHKPYLQSGEESLDDIKDEFEALRKEEDRNFAELIKLKAKTLSEIEVDDVSFKPLSKELYDTIDFYFKSSK